MGYYDRRAESERKERDTPAQIVHIARSKGFFDVSLRWRDDWLHARCKELKRLGFLAGGHRAGRVVRYYPSQKWYWKTHA
jgi:hypothetical protein